MEKSFLDAPERWIGKFSGYYRIYSDPLFRVNASACSPWEYQTLRAHISLVMALGTMNRSAQISISFPGSTAPELWRPLQSHCNPTASTHPAFMVSSWGCPQEHPSTNLLTHCFRVCLQGAQYRTQCKTVSMSMNEWSAGIIKDWLIELISAQRVLYEMN